MSDFDSKRKEFESAEKRASLCLAAKGIIDPRRGVAHLTAEMYPEMRKYDELLASEIIRIMQKPSASPQEPQPVKNQKRDWASSAYDR